MNTTVKLFNGQVVSIQGNEECLNCNPTVQASLDACRELSRNFPGGAVKAVFADYGREMLTMEQLYINPAEQTAGQSGRVW